MPDIKYARAYLGANIPTGQNPDGDFVPFKAGALPGLDIPAHDYIGMSYTGSDLTGVVYKSGGSSGTTVATLTLAYTDGNLTSVTKS